MGGEARRHLHRHPAVNIARKDKASGVAASFVHVTAADEHADDKNRRDSLLDKNTVWRSGHRAYMYSQVCAMKENNLIVRGVDTTSDGGMVRLDRRSQVQKRNHGHDRHDPAA